MKHALTPDEWVGYPKVYFRRPRRIGKSGPSDQGYGVEITGPNDSPGGPGMWVWDDSWAVLIQEPDRHKLAAIALHNQPFGFTKEDVQFLRWCQKDARKKDGPLIAEGFDFERIADRIEALLPPEAP